MIEPFSPDGPRQLLADLCRLVRERAASEVEISAGLVTGKETADQRHQESLESLSVRHQAEKEAVEKEYASARSIILARFESESRQMQKQYDSVRTEANTQFESDQTTAQQQLSTRRWEAMAMSEAAQSGSDLQVNDILAGLESRWEELQKIHRQAVELLQRARPMARFSRSPCDQSVAGTSPGTSVHQGFGLGANSVSDPVPTVYLAVPARVMAFGIVPAVVGNC